MMNIETTPLAGLLIIQPKVFSDNRGFFYETYQQHHYTELGLPAFVQDNISRSSENVLRGLHYQYPHAQGKLVTVIKGTIFDVVVDIRQSSPTFGQWFSITLSDENHQQLYIPPGFAHGFCVLSPSADFCYKCTDFYHPENEHGILWNDPALNIAWPVSQPVLSNKDNQYPLLSEISRDHFPR
jgi:dTDP-4-dehydrorhamnose 3,5-epimerase